MAPRKSSEPILRHTADYFIEKFSDYINKSGSGVSTAPAAAESLIEMLEGLQRKISSAGGKPEETALHTAFYAMRELQKYVNGRNSNIADQTEARVCVEALRSEVKDLQNYERDMETD